MDIRPLVGIFALTIAIGATGSAETVVEPISLPESLRLPVDAISEAGEEPVSAESPANVRDATMQSAKYQTEIDQLQQRLAKFDADAELERRLVTPDYELCRLTQLRKISQGDPKPTEVQRDSGPGLADVIGLRIAMEATGNAETVVEPISLPESLRLPVDADAAAIEEPVSAESPANVRDAAIHPDEVLKSLQESVERLTAAGLEEEAAEATQLLQTFEQKHHARLTLELQSSQSAKHRTELERLQRRLAKFDVDAELERRLKLESELREAEGKLPGFHYEVSEKWLENVSRTRRQPVLEMPHDSVQSRDKHYEGTMHLIDDVTVDRNRVRDNGVDNVSRKKTRSLNATPLRDIPSLEREYELRSFFGNELDAFYRVR